MYYLPHVGTVWMNWALLGSTVVALPLLCIFPERYRRTDLDLTIDVSPPPVGEGDVQHAPDDTDDMTSEA